MARPPKIGLLGLYIELYDRVAPASFQLALCDVVKLGVSTSGPAETYNLVDL